MDAGDWGRSLLRRWSRQLPAGCLLAGCYVAASLLACTVGSLPTGVKPVWWPAGVAFAGVLLVGYRALPIVAAAEVFTGHWLLGLPWDASAVLAAAVTLEAALGTWLVRPRGAMTPLACSRGVLRFVAGGLVVAPGVASVLAAGGLVACGAAEPAQFRGTCWALWIGDAAGILVVTPLLVGLFHARGPFRLAGVAEGVAVVGGTGVLVAILVGWIGAVRRADVRVDLLYALFPVMFWAALRLRQLGAAAVSAVVALGLVVATGQGKGPFAGGSDLPSLLRLDGFLLLFGLSGLITSVAEGERRDAERKREQAYETVAYTDALTGLANKARFRQRFVEALGRTRPTGERVAVLFVDLNDFKRVNDAVGHEAGDQLLKVLSERLVEELPFAETIARVGGDEFTIVLHPTDLTVPPQAVAERLCEGLARPVSIAGRQFRVTPTVGLSFHPDHGSEPEELLRKADMAMYSTKGWPGVRASVYTESLGNRAARQLALLERLKTMQDFQEFQVYYQPFVDLANGRTVGAEALLRWNHPVYGRISPAEFIPLLERSERISGVGEWLIHEACKQAQAWRELGPSDFTIAVNVSPTQLYTGDLRRTVDHALQTSALPASLLTLELTESALIDEDHGSEIIPDLSGDGVQLAVDDFGTGYSALRYLSRFPLQILKIDQAFVAAMLEDSTTAALVRAMVDISRILGMTVVAEGVETPDQARAIREKGCRMAQGYYFSRPLPSGEFTDLLQESPFLPEAGGAGNRRAGGAAAVAGAAKPDTFRTEEE